MEGIDKKKLNQPNSSASNEEKVLNNQNGDKDI